MFDDGARVFGVLRKSPFDHVGFATPEPAPSYPRLLSVVL